MTLALMDARNIPRPFETLKQAARRANNEAVNKLMDYVQNYWMNGPFIPDDWSCYGEDIRTNNEIECWNGKLWIEAKQRALNIYKLAKLLHNDATRALHDMHRKESNYVKASTKRAAAKIKDIWHEYVCTKNHMDTLKKLAQVSDSVCNYVRGNQAETGDTDQDLITHIESE